MAGTTYLHIGLSKTGTTALQQLFDQSYSTLLANGILYPRTGLDSNHHRWVAAAFLQLLPISAEERSATKQSLREEMDATPGSTFLSSEHFAFYFPEEIEELAEFLGRDTIILVTLRQQIRWASATYAEVIRWGFEGTFYDHLLGLEQSLDFAKFLEPWKAQFGDENVRVSLYDEQDSAGPIFRMLGLKDETIALLGKTERQLPSLPAELADWQRALYTTYPDVFALELKLRQIAWELDGERMSRDFVIPREMDDLFASLDRSNDEICRQYGFTSPLFGRTIKELLEENRRSGYVQGSSSRMSAYFDL